MSDLRDYGLGSVGVPKGAPTVKRMLTAENEIAGERPECPSCGCAQLAEIHVVMTEIRLAGVDPASEADATYLGCPACPWASPAVMTLRGGA